MANTALEAAKRKGYEAAARGELRTACPYQNKRTGYRNGVTFSAAFQRWWYAGYDSYSRQADPQEEQTHES